ncbi:cytochrome c biogenesis protein CcdA, partial [bacterium]|nr:cytochrome c biogenesis protein CcdA [bacterium]
MLEIFIALGAGLISFLSPCVLPLIPGYISYISGTSLN